VQNTVVVRGKCVGKLRDEKHTVSGPGFDYICNIEWKKDHAVFDYRWTATADTVPADEWPKYVKQRLKMSEVIGLNVHAESYRSQSSLSAGTIAGVVILATIIGAIKNSDSNRDSQPRTSEKEIRQNIENLQKLRQEIARIPKPTGLNPELDDVLQLGTQTKKAIDLQKQGRTDEAIALARENVAKWPNRPHSWQSMAIVAAMRKENEAADNAFAKWILLAPADPNAQSSFGYFLIQSNQLARAEKVLERASQTFPTSGLVWANYAECLAKLGRGNASREAQAKAEQFLTPKERASLTR
jgi:tetratricopeptide (TPR) repeat protein